MKSEFIFQSSPLFIIPCLLAGVLYSWFLYSKKSTISKNINILLSIMRGLLVSSLAFLLLNFFVKNNTIIIDKPVAVLAIDNSSSLKNLKLNSKLEQIIIDLKASGREIAIEYLGQEENQDVAKIAFNQKTTDLSALINQVKSNYDGRNLTDVILISDGIVNAGVSPIFKKYNFKIHTIGVGDTTKKIDIRLGSVYSNKLAYIGNKFPVQIDVNAFGFSGKQSTVVLKDGGVVIDKQVVSFTSQNDLKTLTLYAVAKTQGLKRYTVEVLPIAGESSIQNNKREIIVEVINGKEKVLIVGLSPHPDIKAIKTIIEKNELYEVQTQILSAEVNTKMPEFDILIMHQLPDIEGMGQNYVLSLMSKNKPTFFIIGSQTNIPSLNGYNDVMGVQLNGNQGDNVSGKYNENFKMFNFDSEKAKILEKLPPVRVPFAEFRPSKEAEILLYQKILNTTTNKPLLAVNINAKRKTAIFTGEGIWKWRMEEFALTDKQEVIDELFLKTLQLLSVKDDKKKLRINPTATQYMFSDKVVFETEAYNNIYEKVYEQNIKMTVADAKGKKYNYEYVNNNSNNSFEISDLPAGDYSYIASTKILGKDESAAGQFFITDVDLESQDLTADWNLLRTIAQKNDGQFVNFKNTNLLIEALNKIQTPAKLSNKEEVNEPINLKYLFFLFLIFATVEWVIRKYLGTY